MSKLVKLFVSFALIFVVFTAAAEARGGHWHGGGGHWHGGGWGGGGWGWGGFGPGWGWGPPYGNYYPGPYYYGGGCGWTRVRVWRGGHWAVRRAWRCW